LRQKTDAPVRSAVGRAPDRIGGAEDKKVLARQIEGPAPAVAAGLGRTRRFDGRTPGLSAGRTRFHERSIFCWLAARRAALAARS